MDAPLLLFLFFAGTSLCGVQPAMVTIKNNCPYTIWPGTLTGAGIPPLPNTGFELAVGASSAPIQIPPHWSGRFWARTSCATGPTGSFACQTADCASGAVTCNGAGAIPPASLVEFTFDGYNGQDFFDISLVDGFNLPVTVEPVGVAASATCTPVACPGNVNAGCQPELALKDASGATVGCKSACVAFNQPQFCCSGAYATAATCQASGYASYFKAMCPQAYSYAYDDKTSTFTCPSGPNNNYLITFCPVPNIATPVAANSSPIPARDSVVKSAAAILSFRYHVFFFFLSAALAYI
ncbi:unnamed protein product [Cuscuta epithymum]|uniref:Thaumatin-like protein n=1 Tax=Cuscuta epithymum TaxID=186058 RepID=A0AAV0CT10_9ASTE|nr:unnamed protein product [Cuscuta epithymum]